MNGDGYTLSILIHFSILSILERTPFLPRGIGVVELAGFVFLSIDSFTLTPLSTGQIATVIIIFDVVRLFVPTIASLAAYGFIFKAGPKSGLKTETQKPRKGSWPQQ